MPNLRSYVDVAESNAMASSIPKASAWIDLDESLKLSSLSYSSKLLDSFFDWSGVIASEDQELRWPRADVYDRDGRLIDKTIVPQVIKDATFLLALDVSSEEINGSTPGNLESLKVGPISLAFDTSESKSEQPISANIISMLSNLGSYTGPRNTNAAYNVRAVR